MKKILAVMLCLVMVLGVFAGCGDKKDNATDGSGSADTGITPVSEMTTLTVGFDAEYAPYGYKDDSGEYVGFDLDLAQEVCDRMGWELKKQPINWDAKDMELNSGTIDCIWNGFTMTGREEDYTWSDPYMNNRQVVVVRSESDIASFDDLAGKIVEVQTDSSAEAALAEMPELTATFSMLQTTPDYNAAFMDLEMGAVDAIAIDVVVASYQMEQRGDGFKMLDGELASEKYGIGFKLGNEALRDQVQAALEEMAADGTVAAISEKWFGSDITTIGK